MGYGFCTASCQLGPRCGDGVITNGEQCDDAAANGTPTDKCQADCTLKCGNGKLDAGEQCDNGTAANTGGYGKCNQNCTLGPRCGDGIKNGTEQCDDGAGNGTNNSTCDIHCKFKCGDGIKDAGEQCDDGVNSGAYGNCNPNCTLAPYCGDGMKNGNEQCDQGASNADAPYGPNTCTKTCKTGPYCGDGRIQTANGEQCDSTPGCDGATCKNKVIP